ncbi:MAG: transglycosylase domain-containing protein, partial [Tepidiformaceae bacterium]
MNPVIRHRLLTGSQRRAAPASHGLLVVAISIAVTATVAVSAAMGVVFAGFMDYASGYTPLQDLVSARSGGVTEIYDRGGPNGGVFLGTLANPDGPLLNPVPLDQISQNLIDATVSTEDNSFWTNPGVDLKGLVRAAWDNYLGGGFGSAGGGSTITQQLVKNIYLTDDCTVVNGAQSCVAPRTLTRKLKEVTYALKVTQQYSKDQILTWYLNQISYGSRYVGIQAAAQGYFRVDASALDLAQAALLAGVPASPTLYHPRLNCVKDAKGACVADDQGRTTVTGAAKARQEEVLDLMVQHKRITAGQAEQAKAEILKIYPPPSTPGSSAWIDDQIEPRLVRMCEAGILPQTPGTSNCTESVHTAGYRVTTTLNYAETQKATALMNKEITQGLAAGCDCHNAAVATIDPATGQVMVYAPNIDPSNVADPQVSGDIDQLVEINQPGSSFKPAVYLAYFQLLNKTPMSSIWDTSPLKIDDPNATKENQPVIINSSPGGLGQGLITARSALGGSQNVPAFRAAEEVGIDNVIKEAKALGITTLQQGFDPTFYQQGSISYGPSIATGGANVRAIDMAY